MSAAARWAARVGPWGWGVLAAAALVRFYFGYAPGEMHFNHEADSYPLRVAAFLDLLRAGYVFPHWVVEFRHGLGSPYFGYYQPGFFYLASAFAAALPMHAALGVALGTLAFAGYGGVFLLIRARFGTAAGMLGGTTLLAAPYARTELYVRGDLSEFAGMMLLPAALCALTAWLDAGRRRAWYGLVAAGTAVLCTHPVAGLFGWGAVVTFTACWTLAGGHRRRAAGAIGALGVAVCLAAFYLAPIALEWDLVEGHRLIANLDFRRGFVGLRELLSLEVVPRRPPMRLGFGRTAQALVAVALATCAAAWPRLAPPQRRLVVAALVTAVGSIGLMHAASTPVWETLTVLRMVQFPWRFLLVVTVCVAILSGCVAVGRRWVAAVGLAAAAWTLLAMPPPAATQWRDREAALEDWTFVPDAAGEWMPRGALMPSREQIAYCVGRCTVDGFTREPGRLRAQVTTTGRSTLVLPHFYFPVGWQATVAGVPVTLRRSDVGLMQIRLYSSGELMVRFGTTPARRLGAIVSGAAAALLLLSAAVGLRRRRAATALALLPLVLATSGCGGTGYLVQSGLAEARILWRREPIAHLLARPDLEAGLRERLRLVLDVRAFADEPLGLRVGDSFSTFADVDGAAVVWVVSAARRDRLEAHTWWYPVVGRVPYQGFFERDDAERAARALAARGLDVDVRPATAFSTLGWFADPLLSSTAKAGPVNLTETVIHELFHATLYVPGATAFNESAATFVGHRGAAAFFCDGPGDDAARCAEARRQWDEVRAHGRLLERYARRLRGLYAAAPGLRARERGRRRLATAAARALVRRGLGVAEELSPPNNARLLSMLAYETDLDTFERLAPSDGMLPDAIGRIVAAARGAPQPFDAVRALATDALHTRRTEIDFDSSWRPPSSPSTSCSGDSPGGSASSGTTSPTGRTCTDAASSSAPGATGGSS